MASEGQERAVSTVQFQLVTSASDSVTALLGILGNVRVQKGTRSNK
jgi:hypothetical protein